MASWPARPAGPADVAAAAHVLVERLDDAVAVSGPAGHHLERVRRLRVGEVVTAADGWGRWRAYDVAAAANGTLELRATSDVGHEAVPVPGLAVAISLTKGDRPEVAVQKLTELGVDRVVVVQAARSVVRWTSSAQGMVRLQRVAREACEQSRRAHVPVVEGPVALELLADEPGLVVADRGGVPADELAAPAGGSWLVLVGPEGGFDPRERELLAGAARLTIGDHVLRAETAAVAVAAVLASRRVRAHFGHDSAKNVPE